MQLNHNFNTGEHTDNNDVPNLPCVVVGLGTVGAILKIHPNKASNPEISFDVNLQPGGVAMFDSHCSHEVLSDQTVQLGKCSSSHMKGKISAVFMANIQKCNCITCETFKKETRKQA